ncbi:uncharacterized protein LOC130807720 isoform X2 [Amaranthus tricolor]|uniref:uncharacterized protein LOC130807720 isoform X2 n=1 Tax=Amaranthus tricolor TaxID=29722 RepID=UPI00258E036C|nr:uncharacterized protein LOC130807720 isoform X2 [Amaranthus tricolor]
MNLSAQDQLSSLVRLQTWVLRVRKSRTIRQGKLEIDNGASLKIAENANKKGKDNSSPPVGCQQLDETHAVDASLDTNNGIYKTGREVIKTTEEALPSHTTKVPELYLNNVPKHVSQHESLNLPDRGNIVEKHVAPMKSEKTVRKRKNKKGKSFGTENRDLYSKRPLDCRIADGKRDVRGELILPVGISKPEKSLETISENLIRCQYKKAVPGKDHPLSTVKELPDEPIKEMATPASVIQSGKSKKRKLKKQPVAEQQLSSLPVNQHLNKPTTGTEERGEQADDIMTEANDITLESVNTAKKRKVNNNEQECRKNADDVSPPSPVKEQQNEKHKEIAAPISVIQSDRDVGVSCLNLNGSSKASGVTTRTHALNHVEEAGPLTDSKINDTQSQKESHGEDHHVEFSETDHFQVNAVSAEAGLLERPSTGNHLVGSKKGRESVINDEKLDTSIPLGAKHSTVSKELTNTLPEASHTPRKTIVSTEGEDDGSESSGSKDLMIQPNKKTKNHPIKLKEDQAGLRRSSFLDAKF